MTFILVLLWSLALLALATMQTCYVYAYQRLLKKSLRDSNDTTSQTAKKASTSAKSEVALVLCLRGIDPELPDCLAGISAQQYRKFQLHIVVDSDDDPAVEFVKGFFADRNCQPALHVIQHASDRCSLKCSALLEALQKIPAHVPTIAFIDADTVPDPNWLGDLVAPLAEEEVGATTGNRWFSPVAESPGSYVRKIWNAAAIVQMDLYNIAWGGSLAIKRSVIEQCQLPDIWRTSFCEDTLLSDVLETHGFKLVRVHSLISLNTESTSFYDSIWWIVRQLITIRLYHPRWPLVKVHGFATTVGSVFSLLGMVLLLVSGIQREFYWLLFVLIAFQSWNIVLLWVVERINVEILESRKSDAKTTAQSINWPLQILAYLLVQLIQPVACVFADRARHVQWRGIKYQIDKQEVLMTDYVPYREINSSGRKSAADSIS